MTTNPSRIFHFKEKGGYPNLHSKPFYGVNGNDAINNIPYDEYFSVVGAETIKLFVQYPGLVTGTGYPHFADDKNDFQMGFFFDHTTGMPVIPGSSVKGILKRVFPKKDDRKNNEIRKEKIKYLGKIIPVLKPVDTDKWEENKWEEIFFGRRQIFCDAYISQTLLDGKIFADDYCTKHGDDLFKEPLPLRFLKIAPGVQITFQFILYDYSENGLNITKHQICDAFERIIMDFGIGAKRNYGYGSLKREKQEVANKIN